MKFNGDEKFTIEFTFEEWGIFTLGLQQLVRTMHETAVAKHDLKIYNHYIQILEKGNEMAQKIADTMGIEVDDILD